MVRLVNGQCVQAHRSQLWLGGVSSADLVTVFGGRVSADSFEASAEEASEPPRGVARSAGAEAFPVSKENRNPA